MKNKYAAVFIFIFCVFCGGVNTHSYALDPNAHLSGKYEGIIIVKSLPQPVFFNVEKLSLGKKSGYVEYSHPRDCRDYVEYSGRVGQKHFFFVSGLNCSHLKGAGDVHYSANRSADGGLVIDVVGSSVGLIESFTVYSK